MTLPGCNQFVRCARDANGWLIPRVGTVARQIYELLLQGKSRKEIVESFPASHPNGIDARIWRIKNPDRANEVRNVANAQRAEARRRKRPTPSRPAVTSWYEIETVPVGAWVRVREEGSLHVQIVRYEESVDQPLHPWVTRDRKRRLRWDLFDHWRDAAALRFQSEESHETALRHLPR